MKPTRPLSDQRGVHPRSVTLKWSKVKNRAAGLVLGDRPTLAHPAEERGGLPHVEEAAIARVAPAVRAALLAGLLQGPSRRQEAHRSLPARASPGAAWKIEARSARTPSGWHVPEPGGPWPWRGAERLEERAISPSARRSRPWLGHTIARGDHFHKELAVRRARRLDMPPSVRILAVRGQETFARGRWRRGIRGGRHHRGRLSRHRRKGAGLRSGSRPPRGQNRRGRQTRNEPLRSAAT